MAQAGGGPPQGLGHACESASAWVVRFAPLIPPGTAVLDLACGRGRHARLLADRGCRVLAVDRDAAALAALAGVAGIETLHADLERGAWPLAGRRFGAIVATNYLHRPLFPCILEALEEAGTLIYETFALGNERFGRPSNPEFLLRPGELLEAFCGPLQVVAFEQGVVERPRRAVVQRLCAVRAAAGHWRALG